MDAMRERVHRHRRKALMPAGLAGQKCLAPSKNTDPNAQNKLDRAPLLDVNTVSSCLLLGLGCKSAMIIITLAARPHNEICCLFKMATSPADLDSIAASEDRLVFGK